MFIYVEVVFAVLHSKSFRDLYDRLELPAVQLFF